LQATQTAQTQTRRANSIWTELTQPCEAIKPVIALWAEDADAGCPIVDLVKDVPARVDAYMRNMAKSCIMRIAPVAAGPPTYCSDERLTQAEEEVDQVATSFAGQLEFV